MTIDLTRNGPARCRLCNAEVLWLTSASTGRVAPIDPVPAPKGNIAIDARRGTYVVVVGWAELHRLDPHRTNPDAQPGLRLNHFATCAGIRRSGPRQRRREAIPAASRLVRG